MSSAASCQSDAELRLAIVARELAGIGDRLHDAAVAARLLSAATDWQARAAVVFHERADAWARDVSGLACLAETARETAARARDRAAARAAWQSGCA